MQNTAEYYCAFCGEPSTTFVDISAGLSQSYVEDCQVCCRPNILYVRFDEDTLEAEIDTEPESDW
ncbi:MAG: CPXCG motif-containing cysteine-rich protein [Geitlerinemataceae cyanobacterium]